MEEVEADNFLVLAVEGMDVVEAEAEAEIDYPLNLDPSSNSEDTACKQRLATQLYWPTNPRASKE